MVNFNGDIDSKDHHFFNQNNRGFRYGDALFETIRVVNGNIYFLEEHYLRLMSSMRILRMEIPMNFTMEFFEEEIKKTIKANKDAPAHRIRFVVFRNDGGFYTPSTNDISHVVEVNELKTPFYVLDEAPYEVELFKDFFVNKDMLSNLKTNNRILNVVAGVYAKENDYQNCFLLNNEKSVVEAINGNIFVVSGSAIKTPPLEDGCLNGIIRKKLISMLKDDVGFNLVAESVSPFELQKADEIFITNTISGIIPVTKYRKKQFNSEISKKLVGRLNTLARLAH
ncbi:aminotransferase class IV [Maribacter litopenaei]|uniref:branched-chain-amino-acid transaminase n=1 Tax=Maribacter litopenaei TaxID=2976127 RepID=A0ABY5YBP5_9FLAO|nr:aminotransferase class IV [Maribacter litopenaei]UWX56256.1 aminotransferase class IV [Maribacter litopenaei]